MAQPGRRVVWKDGPMVVFFDVAGTLITVREGVGAQYARVARHFGVDADPRLLDAAFPAAFRAAPPLAFPGASDAAIPGLERRVWQGIVRGVFEVAGLLPAFPAGAFGAYFDVVYRHFEDPAAWDVFPDVRPAIAALRARGCRLGIISNFDGRIFRILDGLGLAPSFESVTLSSRVGVAKPHPGIFARALERHGVPARAALHVGDSPVEDAEGARDAGLGAVLLDRTARYADRADLRRVASLGEVVDLVGAAG
jgi:putative hydrolase of the HAD superfamily